MSSKVKVTHGLIHQGPARVTPGQAQRNTLNRTVHIQKLSICWSAFPKWSRIRYLTLRKKGSCSEEFRPGMENPLVGCSLRATWTRYRCSEQGSSHKPPAHTCLIEMLRCDRKEKTSMWRKLAGIAPASLWKPKQRLVQQPTPFAINKFHTKAQMT